MADGDLAYPCQAVVGEGQLCGLPCDPGFMRCLEHRQNVPRREIVKMLESTQDRVLLRVNDALEEAVESLIRISTSGLNDSDRLKAIDKLLTLGGFANVKIDAEVGVTLQPEERDKVLIALIREHAQNPEKLAELERKMNAIDASAADS